MHQRKVGRQIQLVIVAENTAEQDPVAMKHPLSWKQTYKVK